MTEHTDQEPSEETGRVKFFNGERGFGFVAPDSGGPDLFYHVTALLAANMVTIRDGAHVAFSRNKDREGRPKVDRFLKVEGRPTAAGRYTKIDGRYVLLEEGEEAPPPAVPPKAAPCRVEITETKPGPRPVAKPQVVEPEPVCVTPEEWVTVTLKKFRKGQVCYVVSDLLGQILVPWHVWEQAKITSAQNHDKFRVRCDTIGEKPVALEIRRGG